jgi:hypothetical protein
MPVAATRTSTRTSRRASGGSWACLSGAPLSRQEKLDRFSAACKAARPDLEDLWDDMDRIPLVWSNAFEYCTGAIEREAASRG